MMKGRIPVSILISMIILSIVPIVASAAAPEVTASKTYSDYTENDNMTVDSAISVTDGDTNVTGAKVSIGDGYVSSEDYLDYTTINGISGSYSTTTGILTLTGNRSGSDYQAAFRNVKYRNSNDNPNTNQRNITFAIGNNSLYNPDTGHYYEYVSATLWWGDARTAASAKSFYGLQGYLATITSAEENAFLVTKVEGDAWIGANDSAVEGNWRWVTGPEGTEDGGQGRQFWQGDASGSVVGGYYNNWNSGEPNDAGGNEDYAQMYGTGGGYWNDLPTSNTMSYFVEYGGMAGDPTLNLTATIIVNVTAVNDAPGVPGAFTSPTGGQIIKGTDSITVSWGTSTDPEGATVKYDLWYFNGTWTQIGNLLGSNSKVYILPEDDTSAAMFRVYANDTELNSSARDVTFTVDSTPPTAPTIDVPANDATLAAAYTWVNGTTSADTTNVTVYVNGTITNLSVSVPSNQFNISGVPLGSDGSKEINVSSIDSVGNVNTTNETVTVIVDTTSPVATFVSPTPADNSNLSQNYIETNVTVTETNLKNVTTYLYNTTGLVTSITNTTSPASCNFTGQADGRYHINATAYDTLGHSNITATRTILLDTTSPVATFVSPTPADNSNLSQNYIETNVTVTETNLKNVTTYLYNTTGLVTSITNTTSPASCNFAGLVEGRYYINATAYDLAGNPNTSATRTILLDTTASVATFVSPTPADNSNLSQNYIETNVTVTETNLKNVTTYLYNTTGLLTSITNTTSPASCNFTGLTDGRYYINATAYDTLGHSNITATRTILLDTTAPVAPTIDVPLNVETLTSAYTWVNGTKSADTTNVTVYVDGSITNASVSVSGTIFNISNVHLGADGVHEINVSAMDAAGNINTTNATVAITVDTAPPTAPTNLIHTDDAPDGYDNDNSTDISWTTASTDDASSVIYRIYRDGVLNASTTFTNYTFTGETEGSHEYNVSANDSAGNINTTNASVTVIVDYTDPVIQNLSLSTETPAYGELITVTVNATDTGGSGIDTITAAGTELDYQSGDMWNGTISAGYGANNVTVIVTDNASNSVTNDSLYYTGPATPTTSSGGSSGVGVGFSDEPENVDESIVLRIYLGAGESEIYNFNNVVTSVEVTPEKTYGLVAAKIEVLAGKPGSITSDPPAGVLYKYVNVFVGTSGWSEGKLSSSVINFQVPASWFNENNIDPASVTLYRHHDGEWQSLTTTRAGPAGEYYQYSSPTPGFSTFMILGQVGDSGTGEPAATDFGTVADSTPTPEATSTSDEGTPGFGILLGIMGIMMAVYLRRK